MASRDTTAAANDEIPNHESPKNTERLNHGNSTFFAIGSFGIRISFAIGYFVVRYSRSRLPPADDLAFEDFFQDFWVWFVIRC